MTNPKPNHLHPHTFLTIKPFKPLKIITMNWFIKCFKQYADFKGRARRREFWWFTLINFIIMFVMMIFMMVPMVKGMINDPEMMEAINDAGVYGSTALDDDYTKQMYSLMMHSTAFYVYCIFCLLILLPSLAVTVRRLHDTGRSGWWFVPLYVGMLLNNIPTLFSCSIGVKMLLMLISLAALIVYLVFMFLDSQEGENKWGPNPKEPRWEDEPQAHEEMPMAEN